jgi:hypothetical protein
VEPEVSDAGTDVRVVSWPVLRAMTDHGKNQVNVTWLLDELSLHCSDETQVDGAYGPLNLNSVTEVREL